MEHGGKECVSSIESCYDVCPGVGHFRIFLKICGEINVLGVRIGAVLMPYHRPLDFFSQAVYERIAGVGKAFRGVDRPKMFEILLEQWVVGGKY